MHGNTINDSNRGFFVYVIIVFVTDMYNSLMKEVFC